LVAVNAVKLCIQQTVIHKGCVSPSSLHKLSSGKIVERAKAMAACVFSASQDWSDLPITFPPHTLKFVEMSTKGCRTCGHDQGSLNAEAILHQDAGSDLGQKCC